MFWYRQITLGGCFIDGPTKESKTKLIAVAVHNGDFDRLDKGIDAACDLAKYHECCIDVDMVGTACVFFMAAHQYDLLIKNHRRFKANSGGEIAIKSASDIMDISETMFQSGE